MATKKNPTPVEPKPRPPFWHLSPLTAHRCLIALLYAIAIVAAYLILKLPEARKDLIALLSAGAIFATFGSAIATLGSLWERDLLERVRLNVDILYKDLLHQTNPWRRWPFLPRSGDRKLLDDLALRGTLQNPRIPLGVGTHVIEIDLPTVLEDFFDLPLVRNVYRLHRFRSAAGTVFANGRGVAINPKTNMKRQDEFMAYECLHDIWRSILIFRIARYSIHFGSGLALAGTALTVYFL